MGGRLTVGVEKPFIVSDKPVRFDTIFSMEVDRVMKIKKGEEVLPMENLITLAGGSKNTILYQENLEDNQGILIKSFKDGTVDFYVHGLAPGNYTILLTDN